MCVYDCVGMAQEVESLLVQLRGFKLDADSWESASVLLCQLGCCVQYCMACTASICWGALARQLDASLDHGSSDV